MLPIYLDHILYPTITDSGFYTEIHHINGDGEDTGVVYSEMQGRQNTGDDLIHHRMRLLLYPGCGYQSETGGLMENLRVLSADTIRRYHRDFYRADNLCLIVTGSVNQERLIAQLEMVEQKYLTKPRDKMFRPRPWVGSPPIAPLKDIVEQTIEFPDEEEATGLVYIGWRSNKVRPNGGRNTTSHP